MQIIVLFVVGLTLASGPSALPSAVPPVVRLASPGDVSGPPAPQPSPLNDTTRPVGG